MDRRKFFKYGLSKLSEVGVGALEHRAKQKARYWIRPPFAKHELDFLLECTRCNACIEACPSQVIFPLPISRGPEVAATPALDLLNKGCQLCSDWPCVTACEAGALTFITEPATTVTEQGEPALSENEPEPHTEIICLPASHECPPLAEVSINPEYCIPYAGPECGACRGSCPIPDALLWRGEKPVINKEACVGCGLCREACITEPKAINISSCAATAVQPNEIQVKRR